MLTTDVQTSVVGIVRTKYRGFPILQQNETVYLSFNVIVMAYLTLGAINLPTATSYHSAGTFCTLETVFLSSQAGLSGGFQMRAGPGLQAFPAGLAAFLGGLQAFLGGLSLNRIFCSKVLCCLY